MPWQGKWVFPDAAQLRRDIKQKVKKAVERVFLQFQLSTINADGSKLSKEAMDQTLWQASEAQVKWLKKDFLFHYGNLKMPNPAEDPGVCILKSHLWMYTERH